MSTDVDAYLIGEAAAELRAVSNEEELEIALRDALEAVLDALDDGEDAPDYGGVSVATLAERGFLTSNCGLALRWPSGLELTLEVGVYSRGAA